MPALRATSWSGSTALRAKWRTRKKLQAECRRTGSLTGPAGRVLGFFNPGLDASRDRSSARFGPDDRLRIVASGGGVATPPSAGGGRSRTSAAAARSDCRGLGRVRALLRRRPPGGGDRPPQRRPARLRPGARSPAARARRSPRRRPRRRRPRLVDRPHQRRRARRTRPRRRLHRDHLRAGVDRHPAVGAGGRERADAGGGRRPCARTSPPPSHDIPIPQNDRVLGYVEAFQGRLRNFLTDGTDPRRRVSADDPRGLPRGGPAARPGLRSAGRERLQADRAVAGERPRRVAVHARHRARERPPARLVHRRARRPRKGDPGGGEVSQDPAPHLRRRLAPGPGVVQRRPRPRAARRQAIGHRRLLAAQRLEEEAAAA